MASLFKIEVRDRVDATGVTLWKSSGELVELGGERYVRVWKTLQPIDGNWFATEADAKRHAVAEITAIASRILAQAARLTDEVIATTATAATNETTEE
jgi:hypothetical protein